MIILFFGAPGTGKTTLAKIAAEHLGLHFIDVGDILRQRALDDPILAKEMDSGELASDSEVNRLVFTLASRDQEGFVLDGFPRDVSQALSLARFLEEHRLKIDKIFDVTIPVELLKARILARGREDDTPQVVEERLKIYNQQTSPVLGFFKTHGYDIINLNNSGPLEETKKELFGHFE